MSHNDNQLDCSIEIVTPENISFRYQVAGPFRRLPAFLLDYAFRILICLGAAWILGILQSVSGFSGWAMLILLYFVIEWFYGGLFETYWNGQTPGKRVLGIRVLSINGEPINGLQAMMRNILRLVDLMPMVPLTALFGEGVYGWTPIGLVGLLTPVLNSRFQRLGDIASGTMVVIEERHWLYDVVRMDDAEAVELAEKFPPNFQVNRKTSRALSAYMERRKFFTKARQQDIARHLAEPLLSQFNLPRDTNYDRLMCALYYRAFVAERGE